jgi:putative ABC transport system substrate-binding protein
MRRRSFLTLLGGAAAWPLAGRAQQSSMPLVAFLNSGSSDGYTPMVAAFRQGLKEGGYVEGQNVAVEYRWAGGQYDRVPAMALELVGRWSLLIVSGQSRSACQSFDSLPTPCEHWMRFQPESPLASSPTVKPKR